MEVRDRQPGRPRSHRPRLNARLFHPKKCGHATEPHEDAIATVSAATERCSPVRASVGCDPEAMTGAGVSDREEGPGWWLASDGKWYPPESHPQVTTPPPAIPQRQATNGMAVASLVLGIVGVVTFGFIVIPSVLAVIFGHLGLSNIKKSGGELGGRGMAIAGLVLGYIGVAWLLFLFASVLISAPGWAGAEWPSRG